jgi:hypothetical protein
MGLVGAGAMSSLSAGAAGITVRPNSNLAVGGGTYAATVTAPKGTFPKVPDPAAVPSARTATTKVLSAALTGTAGTFTSLDIGSFVDDGVGGRLPDGVDVVEVTPLVPVYPRQGLAYIKAVNLTGSSATLSQKAIAPGSGSVNLITPATPQLLVSQSTGSIPFIAPVLPGPGLCWSFTFPGGVCAYDIGNLAMGATSIRTPANADGSLTMPFTVTEGVMDGILGTNPGPVFVHSFDPDGAGTTYGVVPFGVPPTDPDGVPRRCAPDDQDRAIPNPVVGGVDYCIVTAIVLNAGVQTTKIPFQLSSFPLTWAASAGGALFGPDLVITGTDFANDDVIVKIVVANGKAKLTSNPLIKCPVLNQSITGVTANSVGTVVKVIAGYATGCTVPPTSLTKVTLIGTKDIQKSQIPGNLVIGTNLPKKASALISMAPPA